MLGVAVDRAQQRVNVDESFTLPRPRTSAPPIPADVQPNGVALQSFVTASADFAGWTPHSVFPNSATATGGCASHDMVDREVIYSFADLADFEVGEMVTR